MDVLEHLPKRLVPEDTPKPQGVTNWRYAKGDIAQLWLDCADTGTNVISEAVLRELDSLLDMAKTDNPRALVIRSAKAGGFAAGADIDGFADLRGDDAVRMLEQGHAVLDKLAALPFTTIAVVHGNTLGGGLELALACDHRIGVEGGKVGFPEVQLGLHPGLGGTVRLTRLIDPVAAMQMMLTGSSAHDRKARKLGILDALVPERHVEAAISAAAAGKLDHDTGGLRATALRTRAARALAATRMRTEAEKKAPNQHYPAPYALINLWEDHGGDAAGMQMAEMKSFADLLDSATAQNLIRVFFLRRKLKSEGKGKDGIHHVHVIGAGAMGAEIAAWSAMQGKRVTLEDLAIEPLGKAVKRAVGIYDKKHLSGIDARDALDRMMPDPNGLGRARADLVIEAAPEKPEIKEKIYTSLAGVMKPAAILASNTSSLKLADLVATAPDAGRFAGLHFFNPVSQMPLVEVVSHDKAEANTMDRLAAFVQGIDRLPVRVTDYPGFLVNRMLGLYLMEAMVMPCHDDIRTLSADWLAEMVDQGHTGRKSGRGLYNYDKGETPPDTPADDPADSIIDRLILPMCDAGVECLRKGVAQDADDVDAAVIFGTGWAPFRGGPMHYAKVRRDVPQRLEALAAEHGARFAPDKGWASFG